MLFRVCFSPTINKFIFLPFLIFWEKLQTTKKKTKNETVILMDEEAEDIEEEDLDCEGEMDPESPPWHDYGDEDIDDIDVDETTEDTALLQAAAKTEIIITPISPVSAC